MQTGRQDFAPAEGGRAVGALSDPQELGGSDGENAVVLGDKPGVLFCVVHILSFPLSPLITFLSLLVLLHDLCQVL